MSLYPYEFEINLIQLIMVIVMTAWYGIHNKGRGGLTGRLFLWGLLSLVLMNIYWSCMIFVNGAGNYVTFTACDTATMAFVLIWSSMFYLRNKVDVSSKLAWGLVPVSMFAFGLINIVWWTIWSGNLIINILWGLSFAILFYMVCYALHRKDAISKTTKSMWLGLALALTVCECVFPILEGNLYVIMDWLCVILWLLLIVIPMTNGIKDKANRTSWMFIALLFSLYAQYMTDDIRYSVFSAIETVILFALIINFDARHLGEEECI